MRLQNPNPTNQNTFNYVSSFSSAVHLNATKLHIHNNNSIVRNIVLNFNELLLIIPLYHNSENITT